MITTQQDKAEFFGQLIDIFEDFLDEKGVTIDNPEKEDNECAAIIYGSDYDSLRDNINKMMTAWGIINKEE